LAAALDTCSIIYPRHSGMRRKAAQARNVEISGSMLTHRPGMTSYPTL